MWIQQKWSDIYVYTNRVIYLHSNNKQLWGDTYVHMIPMLSLQQVLRDAYTTYLSTNWLVLCRGQQDCGNGDLHTVTCKLGLHKGGRKQYRRNS